MKLDTQIDHMVNEYNRAREALQRLGQSNAKYHKITKSDLKMPGDIVEANRIGQRSDKLPWFWRLDDHVEEAESGPRMKECMYFVIFALSFPLN